MAMLGSDKFLSMVISMPSPAWRYRSVVFLSFALAIAAAIPRAHAAPQEDSFGEPARSRVCSNLGEYIFVGGTGGFDALRDGDQIEQLLKSGHVGLYQHANAIIAAEKSPDDLSAIERVFSGTGPGHGTLTHF